MVIFGVSHTSVFESVWIVVEAVNQLPAMKIEYPSEVAEQKRIAKGFCDASKVNSDCCTGAIDGILIWMHKPSMKEANTAGVGQKKFLCGRKNKFGLNCQAVSDVCGQILDILIMYCGLSSDCLAFEASNLHTWLENGLLVDGLVLFRDNAYLKKVYDNTVYEHCRPSLSFSFLLASIFVLSMSACPCFSILVPKDAITELVMFCWIASHCHPYIKLPMELCLTHLPNTSNCTKQEKDGTVK